MLLFRTLQLFKVKPLQVSLRKNKSFFITTPIFYVNSAPHLGHLYSSVIADASQRFQKILGVTDITFSVGTDEHGLKIQQMALSEGLTPKQLCNINSPKFQKLFQSYDIDYSNFIRTTDPDHQVAVQTFYKTIESKNLIYESEYKGWYCVSDEAFLTNLQVKEDPPHSKQYVSIESNKPVEWNVEKNYKFKLSDFTDDLLYWLKDEGRVIPSRFQKELQEWVHSGLFDLSVSRPKSRVDWGIPVPNNESHSIYVWVDALINYLTIAGYPNLKKWPPDSQVIGKDILRFHGIYWPALLMAANLEPPRQLLVHCHWQCDGLKMSKSLGNVVSPFDVKINSDSMRYVLLKLGTPHSDNTWNTQKAIECINADLANTWGNLINRCTANSVKKMLVFPNLSKQFVPKNQGLYDEINLKMKEIPPLIEKYYLECNFYKGIDEILALLRLTNLFLQEEKFWKLKDCPEAFNSILHIGLRSSVFAAIALQPIIPNSCDAVLTMLNIPLDKRSFEFLYKLDFDSLSGSKLNETVIPFKRIIL